MTAPAPAKYPGSGQLRLRLRNPGEGCGREVGGEGCGRKVKGVWMVVKSKEGR